MKQQVGRLALRVEGECWSAYYAMPDTMDGALHLASIRKKSVERVARKEAFMALMQEIVADMIEEALGTRPTWDPPKPAPEHERGGSA